MSKRKGSTINPDPMEKRRKELFDDVKSGFTKLHRGLALAIRSKNKLQLAEASAELLYSLHEAYNALQPDQKRQLNLSTPETVFLNRSRTVDGAKRAILERLAEYEIGGSSTLLSGTRYNSSRASTTNADEKSIITLANITLRAAGVDTILKLDAALSPLVGLGTVQRKIDLSCQTVSLVTVYTSCLGLNAEVCKKIIGQNTVRRRDDRADEPHTGNVLPENSGKLLSSPIYRFWLNILMKKQRVTFDMLVQEALKNTRLIL